MFVMLISTYSMCTLHAYNDCKLENFIADLTWKIIQVHIICLVFQLLYNLFLVFYNIFIIIDLFIPEKESREVFLILWLLKFSTLFLNTHFTISAMHNLYSNLLYITSC